MNDSGANHRHLLIVDRSEAECAALRTIVESGWRAGAESSPTRTENQRPWTIDSAHNGTAAVYRMLEAARQDQPYALAFIQRELDGAWDGIETAQYLWEVDPSLEVVLTTDGDDSSRGDIVRRVGSSDHLLLIRRPYDPEEVWLAALALTEKWRLRRQAEIRQDELVRVLRARAVELIATQDITVFALAKLAESRDPETGEHLERMRGYAQVLGEQLADEGPYKDQIDQRFLEDLYRSAPLHDVGKVGIPDAVLLKPGKLSPPEFEIMKQHVRIGADALRFAANHSIGGGFLRMAVEIAEYHHERFDGRGYLKGLRGTEIPLAARIVALADVFDALTSRRAYKAAISPSDARKMIEAEENRHFDPVVVDAFRRRFDDMLVVGGLTRRRRRPRRIHEAIQPT